MDISQDYRQSVKGLIELLSSEEQQLQYKDSLSVGDPAAELVCMWFDDTYHPETDLFQRAFTTSEAQLLESFNIMYSKCLDKLPNTLEKYHQSPQWKHIMSEAKLLLDRIQW